MTGALLVMGGDLASQSLLPWICHRARLLSLKGSVRRDSDTAVSLWLSGPEPLIDAMEVACLLGPADVLVEDMSRSLYQFDTAPNGFDAI